MLEPEYEVFCVADAASAIALIAEEEPFEVIITDLKMPDMDGIELLRWTSVHSPDSCGILFSGHADLGVVIGAVNAGQIFRFLSKPCPPDELLVAVRAAHEKFAARRANRILLRHAIDEDILTGLPDRRRFVEDVARLRQAEPGATQALIVVAVDEIDLIRRTLGFAFADGLIVEAARRMQSFIRDPKFLLRHAVLFRIDDYLALLWCENGQARSSEVAEHLVAGMAADVSVLGQRLRLGIHAGIASINEDEPLTALCNAEAACLDAMRQSGSRIGLFSVSAHLKEQRRLQLLQRLRSPEFLQHLSLVYQPQWELERNRLVGIEALVRWQDPELGAISPAEFVPLTEEHADTAALLGDWVLLNACRQRRAWRELVPDDVRLAVNISAAQLRTGDLHERVLRSLRQADLAATLIEVEITESAAIADFTKSDAQLQALRRSGVNVAIDDFGVGFSSLSYLAQLPATTLKIDRSFLAGIGEGTRHVDLLRGICSLGHAMHMSVVAEGVESMAVMRWIGGIGCDVVQGYAIARPATPSAFAHWYRNESPGFAASMPAAKPRPVAINSRF